LSEVLLIGTFESDIYKTNHKQKLHSHNMQILIK